MHQGYRQVHYILCWFIPTHLEKSLHAAHASSTIGLQVHVWCTCSVFGLLPTARRKREEDEAREAKKESKFGRHRRFAHGGHEEAGTRMTGQAHGAHRSAACWLAVVGKVQVQHCAQHGAAERACCSLKCRAQEAPVAVCLSAIPLSALNTWLAPAHVPSSLTRPPVRPLGAPAGASVTSWATTRRWASTWRRRVRLRGRGGEDADVRSI